VNLNFPPRFGSIPSLFRQPLTLLAGVLLWLAPMLAPAQSVKFADAQSMLPTSGLPLPTSVAVERDGSVLIADTFSKRVAEVPWTGSGYGPQKTLPTGSLGDPTCIAVDSLGDVFVVDYPADRVVELPKASTGWGPVLTLPFSGLSKPDAVAIDTEGDVFVTSTNIDDNRGEVYELPRAETGYGPQQTLPTVGLGNPLGIAVDTAGDVFVTDYFHDRLVELPWTETGYGPQTDVRDGSFHSPHGIAVDSAGNLVVSNQKTGTVVELPKTATGFGVHRVLSTSDLDIPEGVAVDSSGEVFVADYSPEPSGSNVVELQTHSVNFWSAYVCASGPTTPTGCNTTLTLNYNVSAGGTLGTPNVLTGGAANLDFTLASGSTCTGTVAAGTSCTVNVTFAPLSAGIRNGSAEIVDSSGTVLSTTKVYGLGLEATGNPVVKVSTDYLDFYPTAITLLGTLPLTVSNVGKGGPLTVTPSISSYSGGPSPTYSIQEGTCAAGVMPGNSCILQVGFSPTTVATHYGLLTVETNGAANPTVGLHGRAIGLSVLGGVSYQPLKFGSVALGSTEVLPLTVTNVGLPGTVYIDTWITVRSTIHLTTTYTVLKTAQNTCQAGITSGQSCILPIEFAPTTSGIHDDLLTLLPSVQGGSTTVWLSGSTP